jgi:hypothetical protein
MAWNVVLLVSVVALVVTNIWGGIYERRQNERHRREIEQFWRETFERWRREHPAEKS